MDGFTILSLMIVYFTIPILFIIRNVLYKKYKLHQWYGEDILFCMMMSFILFIIATLLKSDFIGMMSLPFGVYSIQTIAYVIIRKRKNRK